jgi:2-polyprenyl-3-methyl-5-hydroxy-6-metoxy-1,4-benzoquinol methylase
MKIKQFYNNRYKAKKFDIRKNKTDHIFMLEKVLDNISTKDKKILDIGAGDGYILKKTKSKNLTALDLSEDNILHLQKNNIETYKLDISSDELPFKNGTFDIIIMNEVIEHIFDCQTSINNVFKMLKKNGFFIIATHNSFNLLMRVKYMLGMIPTPSLDVNSATMGEHIRLFNYNTLETLLLRAGFKKYKINNKSWFKYRKIYFYTKFFSNIFSRHFLLVCRK